MSNPDQSPSSHWAIASVGGGGAVVGVNLFDLVNLDNGRAHGVILTTGGISVGLSASASAPSYFEFTTRKPVNFSDFDGAGARISSANLGVFYGYGINYLTLWSGPVYQGSILAKITIRDWGVMLPGGSAGAHGVLKVTFGVGRPMGPLDVGLHLHLKEDITPQERLTRIQIKPHEPPLTLPADVLFHFDSAKLRPDAIAVLRSAATVINRRDTRDVSIHGHTDSKGLPTYNLKLALARADSVRRWLIDEKVPGARAFRVKGWGEARPVARNGKPDGSDDPVGRQKNRRVEIRFGGN